MRAAILGSGSWGLTLGMVLCDNGHQVSFWTPSSREAESLSRLKAAPDKLPGIALPDNFQYFTHLPSALSGADLVVLAVPSVHMASTVALLDLSPCKSALVVSVTKGILEQTLQCMSEVVQSGVSWLNPENFVALSGPSHAEEVSRKILTSVVAAGPREAALQVQHIFSNGYFRVYTSPDLLGVELAGSLKNVIAIATGILDGLGLGDNTRSALMTRGLAEIKRLGVAMGAQAHTFYGLAGMGDLITTCTSRHSRNRHVGEGVGRGQTLKQVLDSMVMVAEGVPTCRSACALAAKKNVEMPITQAVYQILFNDLPATQAASALMTRELKSELE